MRDRVGEMGAAESVDRPNVYAWRCEICGEVVLTRFDPVDCPFCGSVAHMRSREPAAERDADPNDLTGKTKLAETDVRNLRTSLAMERTDIARYDAMASSSGVGWVRETFERLAAIEAKHASIFEKLLMTGAGAVAGPSEQKAEPVTFKANMGISLKGELAASEKYAEFAVVENANERLVTVWTALARAEYHHYLMLATLWRAMHSADPKEEEEEEASEEEEEEEEAN